MAEIKVTPALLRERANSLRGFKEEHDGAMNKIKTLIDNLPGEFTGEAASSYIEKFHGMQTTFTNFSELLDSLAKKLDDVANNFENTDNANK